MIRILFFIAGIGTFLFYSSGCQSGLKPNPNLVKSGVYLMVGTYTHSGSTSMDSGIYIFNMDTLKGALDFVSASPVTSNPSFLAIHPNHTLVYAVNETAPGGVSAFSLDTTNLTLHFLNKVPSMGDYPCSITLSDDGKIVLVANYGSGTVASFRITDEGRLDSAVSTDQHTGKGPNVKRQEGPHAHMILGSPDGRYFYSTDLGTDKIYTYTLDTVSGQLLRSDEEISTESGAGPRHMVFNKPGTMLYVITELSGTIECYSCDLTSGGLTRIQKISTLPAGDPGTPASADIHITPDGNFLYASNRADENNLVIYKINPADGTLELLGHQATGGKTPRNFAIDPTGRYLYVANQSSNLIVVFRINTGTGLLEETGLTVKVPAPVCLKFF